MQYGFIQQKCVSPDNFAHPVIIETTSAVGLPCSLSISLSPSLPHSCFFLSHSTLIHFPSIFPSSLFSLSFSFSPSLFPSHFLLLPFLLIFSFSLFFSFSPSLFPSQFLLSSSSSPHSATRRKCLTIPSS